MLMLMIIFFMILTFTLMIMMLSNILSKKMIIDREKSSPFECGFDPESSSRIPFSLHFFLITVIFLIFDVEITLIMPMILMIKMTSLIMFSKMMIIMILILILGLYHEWNQGALNWNY